MQRKLSCPLINNLSIALILEADIQNCILERVRVSYNLSVCSVKQYGFSGYLEKAYVFDLFDMPYTLYDLAYSIWNAGSHI